MAEKLCTLRKKGGGKMKETVLWTNPSPTSDFAGVVVDLSDNISHYKYIGIVGAYSKSSNSHTLECMYPTDELVNATSGSDYPTMCLGAYRNAYYFRLINYSSDTMLAISSARTCTTSQAATTVNSAMIPLTIKGYK